MNGCSPSEKSLFLQAVEVSAADRPAFLDHACGNDKRLRREIENLLQLHEQSGDLLDMPDSPVAVTAIPSLSERPGVQIGPYTLLEEIGEGGMGRVFSADQQEPVQRRVALKIIKPGMDTRNVIGRFEAELHALEMMDHPNIAHVLDAGATDSGRPYFVMELVDGVPITRHCDDAQLTIRQRLDLFVSLCEAVQHAHQKGIIHRDIKPSNILVALKDAQAVPKIIDFGIAKATSKQLTDETAFTSDGQIVGTPLYMSPEQATANGQDVDTRSDIYSLGVLLFELLTGTTPFDKKQVRTAGLDEVRRLIREQEPPRPSDRITTLGMAATTVSEHRKTDPAKLSHLLRGELDWIVMKALGKDRTRRYQTASALARDIQRYLNDEAVEACPPSTTYRLRKFARRHKAKFVAAATIAVVLLIATVVSSSLAVWAFKAEGVAHTNLAQSRRSEAIAKRDRTAALDARALAEKQERLAKQQRELAIAQRDLSERNLYVAHMRLAQQDWEAGHANGLFSVLDSWFLKADQTDFRGWEWYYFLSQCHGELLSMYQDSHVLEVAWRPDGRRLASASRTTVKVWDPNTGREILTMKGPAGRQALAWSPDGGRLVSAQDSSIKIWNADTGQELLILKGHTKRITAITWSPDGRHLASTSQDQTVRIWDPVEGREAHTLHGHTGITNAVAWSPGSQRLASAGLDGTIKIWNVDTMKETTTLRGHQLGVDAVAWGPEGKRIVSGGLDRTVRIWDVSTGRESLIMRGHASRVVSVAWSPDGTRIASGSHDETIRIWDAATGAEIHAILGHVDEVRDVSWSPDGHRLASASGSGAIRVWDASEQRDTLTVSAHDDAVRSVAFSSAGHWLASASWDGTVKIWDAASLNAIRTLCQDRGKVCDLAWSPNEEQLAVAADNRVEVWDLANRQQLHVLQGHPSPVYSVAWNPNGRFLASANGQPKEEARTIKVWNPIAGTEVATHVFSDSGVGRSGTVCWGPDGRYLAVTEGRGLRILDMDLERWGPAMFTIDGSPHSEGLAWSPDGQSFAVGCWHDVAVFDPGQASPLFVLRGHHGRVSDLSWSPDCRRLASASEDRTVRIWDPAVGHLLVTFRLDSMPHAVAWSSDGQRLVAGCDDGTMEVWDTSRGRQLAKTGAYEHDLIRRLVLQGQGQQAMERLRGLGEYPILSLAPTSHLYKRRAAAQFELGNFDEALADLQTAVELKPEEASTLVWVPPKDVAVCPDEGYRQGLLELADRTIELTNGYFGAYAVRARLLAAFGREEEALVDIKKAFDSLPDGVLSNHLTIAVAKVAHRKEAIPYLIRLAEIQPQNPLYWYGAALAQLGAGLLDQYRATCAQMLSEFRGTRDASEGHWLAWTCALAPDAVSDLSGVVSAAQLAAQSDAESASHLNTLGGILHRAGRVEEAIQRLTEANRLMEKPDTDGRTSPAYTWYFLAMAHHKLGHDAEAAKWLERANAWTDKVLRDHEEGAAKAPWNRRLTLKLLREEAEAMIGTDEK